MSSHKSIEIQELVESVGATIKYLPPYSPDKNPNRVNVVKGKSRAEKSRRSND